VGRADLFPARAVSVLLGGAAPGGDLRPGRSVGGRRVDVGSRLARLPGAAVRHRRAITVRPGIRSQESGVGRQASGDQVGPRADRIATGELFSDPWLPTPGSWLRPASCSAAGSLPQMASRPARPAVPIAAVDRAGHY